MTDSNHRLLTPVDVEQAAHVIAEAFMDDPLVSFTLPFRPTRLQTLVKLFRIYGEINVRNERAYGVGEPLKAVAFWMFPDQKSLSIIIRTIGKLLLLIFTMYPIGTLRARKVLE